MKVKITKEQEEFLSRGTMIKEFDGVGLFYLPFWYQKNPDGTWEEHFLDTIPKKMKEIIMRHRNLYIADEIVTKDKNGKTQVYGDNNELRSSQG